MEYPLIDVKVLTPSKVVFDGKAQGVRSENVAGPFSIISGHARFISLIKNKPLVVINQEGKKLDFGANTAFVIYNSDNRVLIFSNDNDLQINKDA